MKLVSDFAYLSYQYLIIDVELGNDLGFNMSFFTQLISKERMCFYMVILEFKAKSFKKMDSPLEGENRKAKYVCYAKANTIPFELNNWLSTNPREQKMTTNVAKNIKESLIENEDFHELNRGIVLSVNKVTYDNKTNTVQIELEDSEIHGNIDGGHTLRAIFELNEKNMVKDDRYVFMEIFTGIDSPVELASARNTSVQVDLKSIEELQKSFDVLKDILSGLEFSNRIAYKMNEHCNDDIDPIDVREIIALISMFSQTLYPYKNEDGTLCDQQPIQCYTGKDATLKKFVKIKKEEREEMLLRMKGIIPDIFKIWEYIETNFAYLSQKAGKRYTSRKYSKYDDKNIVSKSKFYEKDMHYVVPKGMIYPIVGAFRSLITIDPETNNYKWIKDIDFMLEKMASKLVGIVLDENAENTDVLGKNANLWSNLFKELYIEGYLI